VLGDLLGSVAAMIAAAVVMIWGWLYADPVLTLVIVVILGRGAYGVLRESAHILLEGVPAGVNLAQIKTTLTEEIKDVDGVHHVHAWGLTAEKPLLTLHALIPENAEVQKVVADIKRLLKERFDIEHSTIQVELGPCPDDQHGHGH
jgi:cobalt-zinc-cadmium efflux system protein